MNYELDLYREHENGNIQLVAILTGMPDDEIEKVCPEKDSWGGQAFVQVFKRLGFNTNQRFEKFDPDTDKPCIMRTTCYQRGHWFAWIYYKGVVYEDPLNHTPLEEWRKKWHKLKITSMLQVWI